MAIGRITARAADHQASAEQAPTADFAFFSNSDPADRAEHRLPEKALLHYQDLVQRKGEAHTVMMSVGDQLFAMRQQRAGIKAGRDHLLVVHGLMVDESHPSILHEDKKLAAIDRMLPGLQKRHDELKPPYQEIGGLVAAIERWLDDTPGKISDLDCSATLRKGETIPQAIERCRRRIRELRADGDKYRASPHHAEKEKIKMRAAVRRIAELGRPDFSAMIDHDGDIRWPVNAMNRSEAGPLKAAIGEFPNTTFDGLAFYIWDNADRLIPKFEKEIEADAEDDAALSDADRAKLIAETERDLMANAIDEECYIRMSEKAGAPILRRRDAPPAAVLQVTVTT